MTAFFTAGPHIIFGQIAQISGGAGVDYNPSLGPSMSWGGMGIIDTRFNIGPGGRTSDGATGWLLASSATLDANPSVNAANNIAASQTPVAGTALTLVSSTAAGVTVGISVQNSTTGALVTGCLGLDVAASATNGNFGRVIFGQTGSVKVWDSANAVARNVVITSAGNDTTATFTVRGYDIYNYPMTETITGANATAANGVKAFKYIVSVTPAGTLSGSAVTVGTGLVFGLPIRADTVAQFIQDFNGALPTTVANFVAAVTTTATATTGDVRGTFTLTAPSTVKNLNILSYPSVANIALGSTGLVGVTQF
jgi:VCBS repeat-containing protein